MFFGVHDNLATAMAFLHLGAVHTMQAFEAEPHSLGMNFKRTCFVATASATPDAANLTRQFALVPYDLISSPAASPRNIHFVRPETLLD